ncbi:MAG: hypothetical protein IKC09_09850 [Oscillospiraceae bacterium]|nr:hypothetical protein [Oscillospiraceae bacterium]
MDWKRIGKALLFPPVWVLVVLTGVSAWSLTAIFLNGWEETVPACFAYALAAYTLVADTVFLVRVLPGRYRQIRQTIYDNPLGNRYMTDRAFRSRVSLYLSLAINLLYVALQGVQWYLQRSWWFVVLGAYYAILSVMRLLLVRYVVKSKTQISVIREWQISRVCSYILLLLNLFLSGAVLMILYQNRGFHYDGVLIYVMALYTFYSVIHAVVELVRWRKAGSPVLSTAKVVSLCAAVVSLLNLETAMFSQFGADMAPEHQRLMIILTGAGISATVITLSVLRIRKAGKEIRSMKNGTK